MAGSAWSVEVAVVVPEVSVVVVWLTCVCVAVVVLIVVVGASVVLVVVAVEVSVGGRGGAIVGEGAQSSTPSPSSSGPSVGLEQVCQLSGVATASIPPPPRSFFKNSGSHMHFTLHNSVHNPDPSFQSYTGWQPGHRRSRLCRQCGRCSCSH